jgi:hypothetical protein
MINVKVNGVEGVVGGLESMAGGVPMEIQIFLDRAAQQVSERLNEEAPKGQTQQLSRNIEITAPNEFTRMIEPVALNLSGGKYALPVETGSKNYPSKPPYQNIAAYYGISPSLAFAIAASIQKKGTPQNDFVTRAYGWVQGMIGDETAPFVESIIARYKIGGV